MTVQVQRLGRKVNTRNKNIFRNPGNLVVTISVVIYEKYLDPALILRFYTKLLAKFSYTILALRNTCTHTANITESSL